MSIVLPARSSNGHADYAPPQHPERAVVLADATLRAVDQIGETTARQIEETAEEMRRLGNEVGQKLDELAAAVRGHTKVAAGRVNDFVQKTTAVLEGVKGLQEKIERETRQ